MIPKIIILTAVCIGLSLTQVNAYACDDVIILEKAKNGELGQLKAYLKKCRAEDKKKNDEFNSILKSCNPVLTKEEKEARAKKSAAYDAEIKRLKEKTKNSLRSVDGIKDYGMKL